MPTPVFGDTFGEIKISILRAVHGVLAEGTADAGTASTLDDAVLTDANDLRLLGAYIYLYNGPGQGDWREITAFTAASDRVTVTPNFSATPTTATQYWISRYHPLDVQDAIRRSLMMLGKYAKDYVDQSLIAGSPVINGTFYDNSGTFPNGWTRTGTGGTFTRVTTVSKHGRYACQIVSDGTNAAGIRQDIPNEGRFRGLSLVFKGWVWINAASRVTIAIDDGVTTQTSTAVTDTSRGWGTTELETPSLTIGNNATRLRVACDISSGGAVTARFSGMWINVPLRVDEIDVPAGGLNCIQAVSYEKDGSFIYHFPLHTIQKVGETTRRLRFRDKMPPQGHILELAGRTSWADFATQTTDDDTTFDGDAGWLVNQAAAFLLKSRGDREWEGYQLLADKTFPGATRLPSGAMKIEAQ